MLNMLFPVEDVHTKQISINGLEKWKTSLADPRDMPPSQSDFFHCRAVFRKNLANYRLRLHLWGGPPSGKHGIRDWIIFSCLFFFNNLVVLTCMVKPQELFSLYRIIVLLLRFSSGAVLMTLSPSSSRSSPWDG